MTAEEFAKRFEKRLLEKINEIYVEKVEDLNVKGMIKNHRLAEAISECSWSMFINMLQYKCGWNEKSLLKLTGSIRRVRPAASAVSWRRKSGT